MSKVKDLEVLLSKCESKSDKMRLLYDNNMSISDISKKLDSHYSFVYSVIQKHTNNNIRKEVKESTADVIRKMYDDNDNITIGEIAKTLNKNYSYVFSVVKKHRESKESK